MQAPSFTGSLFGTASWAVRALTASLATTASFTISASFATTASFAITALSASFATSASLAVNNYVTASSIADYIRLTKGDGTMDSVEVIIGGNDHSVAYFSGSNNIEDATDIKIYDSTYNGKSTLRAGVIEQNFGPTTFGYSGSHLLIDGRELFTNARVAAAGTTIVFLGFSDSSTAQLSSTEVYQAKSIWTQYNNQSSFTSGRVHAGTLNIGGFYGVQGQNGEAVIYTDGIVVGPGSPGFVINEGKLSIFRSESMVFNTSGSLLSPLASASAQFTLASDSSSLSILVGKENLQEVMFLSYSLKEPKIGIGTSQPKSIFDIKSIADNSIGTELLIRSARTELKGGDTGDAAGKIIFSIDSSSYNSLKTSGSVAIITSEVTSISSEGAAGDLILKASNIDKNEPSEVLRINNDTSIFSSSLNVKGQLLTLSSSQFAVISTTIGSDANTNVDTFSTSVYKGGFYDYTLMSSAGARIGQFMTLSGSGGVTFTDVSAPSIGGDTAEPSLSASFSGGTISVRITNGNGYTFKAIRRLL